MCCSTSLNTSKDIRCHVQPYSFLCLHITRSDIRPHVQWVVNLVITDDHLITDRSLSIIMVLVQVEIV